MIIYSARFPHYEFRDEHVLSEVVRPHSIRKTCVETTELALIQLVCERVYPIHAGRTILFVCVCVRFRRRRT